MFGRATAAAAILLATASAAEAVTEWRGGTILLAITPQCSQEGFIQGDYFNTRYRHANVGGANDETRMVFLQRFTGMGIIAEGVIGKEFEEVQAGYVGSTVFFDDLGVEIRFTSISPAKIDKTTGALVIEGNIRTFGGIEGCDVGFRSTLGLTAE
jgi:hypothetical protein